MIMARRKVIIVTDGDRKACKTLEWAARQIGGRCISLSAGNPTPLSGESIVDQVKKTPYDPVIVMVDDKGCSGYGRGEQALEAIVRHPEVEVLGVLAVASNTDCTEGIHPDICIDRWGNMSDGPVDKMGQREMPGHLYLEGDTVDILNSLDIPVVIGIGDIGKMEQADDLGKGSPITLAALQEILQRSGYWHSGEESGKNKSQ